MHSETESLGESDAASTISSNAPRVFRWSKFVRNLYGEFQREYSSFHVLKKVLTKLIKFKQR